MSCMGTEAPNAGAHPIDDSAAPPCLRMESECTRVSAWFEFELELQERLVVFNRAHFITRSHWDSQIALPAAVITRYDEQQNPLEECVIGTH
eukprot:gene39998-54539_t